MTLSRIEKYVKQGRLLDIGCGSGHFLKYVKEKKNRWICYGVEPNEKLLKYASSHNGIEVKKGFITKIPYPDEYFDVITCNDVLEHSIELNRNIIEIRRVLKKNGIILIQSPNFQSLMRIITGNKWDWWSIPDHVLHFSPEFLNSYLIKNGFKVLEKYTYEDSYDYLSNIYGLFSKQYLKKIGVMLLTPLLIILERISWLINYGGLLVFVVRK